MQGISQAYQEYLRIHDPDKLLLDLDEFTEIYNLRNAEMIGLEVQLSQLAADLASAVQRNGVLLEVSQQLVALVAQFRAERKQ